MIRAIIIDDEKPSKEALVNYIQDYCPDVKVIATARSVSTGIKTIEKFKPDLAFLDIELGDGNGFEILKKIRNIDFRVIFVTAYSEYALNAFRVNAVDYLLKPIKIDELKEAVHKAEKVISDDPGYHLKLKNLMSSISAENTNTISVSHTNGFDVLRKCDIILCKADSYCTEFYLTDRRKIISSRNLKHYEDLLLGSGFLRVHHSYLINIQHVCGCSKQGEISLTGEHKAMLGDKYKTSFKKIFSEK